MRKPRSVCITLLYIALGGMAIPLFASPKAPTSTIEDIRHELLQLPYYGVFDFLSFRYDAGTVDLMGYAFRPTLKSDAERALKRVAGVDIVNDQVEELPVSIADDNLRWQTVLRHLPRFVSIALRARRRTAVGASPPVQPARSVSVWSVTVSRQ